MHTSFFKEHDDLNQAVPCASGCHVIVTTPDGFDPEIRLVLTGMDLSSIAEVRMDASSALQLSDKLNEAYEVCIRRIEDREVF